MNLNRFLWSMALALVAYSFVLIPAAMAGGTVGAGDRSGRGRAGKPVVATPAPLQHAVPQLRS